MSEQSAEVLRGKLLFRNEEIFAAHEACRYWRVALILDIFCSYLSLVCQIVACYHLHRARNTLRTPVLANILSIAWPGSSLAYHAISLANVHLPIEALCGAYVAHLIVTFFVTLAIFRQWASHLHRQELDQLVGNWERMAMMTRFPVAAIYLWILTISISEGWNFSEFAWPGLSKYESFGMAGTAIVFVGLALWTLIYEYQVLKRFEDLCWNVTTTKNDRRILRRIHKQKPSSQLSEEENKPEPEGAK